MALGRFLVDRRRPDEPRKRIVDGEERTDADVFDAVRDDDRTGPIPPVGAGAAATEEHTSAVATAERDDNTEVIDYPEAEGKK